MHLPLWSCDTEDVGDADGGCAVRLSGLPALATTGLTPPPPAAAAAGALRDCRGGGAAAALAGAVGAAPWAPGAGRALAAVRSVAAGLEADGGAAGGNASAEPSGAMRGCGSECPAAICQSAWAAAERTAASSSSDLPACLVTIVGT
jgi:hypothetical protein